VIEVHTVTREVKFPYIPGLLSFREVPALLEAFAQLVQTPYAVMLDGWGIARPRRFGLACHLGLWLDVPCLGRAKSWLIGDHDEPDPLAWDSMPLTIGGEAVGTVMRSAANAKLDLPELLPVRGVESLPLAKPRRSRTKPLTFGEAVIA
jgi:deoxyribonuclease V